MAPLPANPSSRRSKGQGEAKALPPLAVLASVVSWLFTCLRCRKMSKPTASTGDGNPHGILRNPGAGSRRPGLRIGWELPAEGDGDEAHFDALAKAREAERELRESWLAYYKAVRLPALTYEQLMIPVRVTFPISLVHHPAFIVLDLMVDISELAAIAMLLYDEVKTRRALTPVERADQGLSAYHYSLGRFPLDLTTVLVLHIGRFLFGVFDVRHLWYVGQAVRLARV